MPSARRKYRAPGRISKLLTHLRLLGWAEPAGGPVHGQADQNPTYWIRNVQIFG